MVHIITLNNGLDHLAKLISDKKGEDFSVLNLPSDRSYTDHMVIANGNSSRNLQALCDHIKENFPEPLHGLEGYRSGEWILMDYGHIVIHLMLPNVRARYDLEKLWTVGDWHPDEYLVDETETPLARKIREMQRNFTAQKVRPLL